VERFVGREQHRAREGRTCYGYKSTEIFAISPSELVSAGFFLFFSDLNTYSLDVLFNLDGAPIASRSHTHPSHSQTSRLLTSSLSVGVPVPRPTQCVERRVNLLL
jgi:hypothetical protein